MAINPLISLEAKVPDVGRAFSNVLTSLDSLENIKRKRAEAPARQQLLNAQAQMAETQIPTEQQKFDAGQLSMISSLATGAKKILPDLQAGDFGRVKNTLEQRRQSLISSNLPTGETDEALALLQSDPQRLARISQQAIDLEQRFQPAKKAVQFGGQQTFKDEEGNLFFGTTARTPATGEMRTVFSAIGGSDAQPVGKVGLVSSSGQTVAEKLETEREQSQIAIQEARGKEKVKLIEKRASDLRSEMATRNRNAARSQAKVEEALSIASKSTQGVSGQLKLVASRLFPGIDASDEGALDAALKGLALDQLAAFVGTTTDFEFGVSQAITGELGQGAKANRARLKSLQRASWFNQREFEQYNKYVKSGADPDSFRFNINEPIKTKKRPKQIPGGPPVNEFFTLKDIRDTAAKNHLSIEETLDRLNK